jgi:hypothetical protein
MIGPLDDTDPTTIGHIIDAMCPSEVGTVIDACGCLAARATELATDAYDKDNRARLFKASLHFQMICNAAKAERDTR